MPVYICGTIFLEFFLELQILQTKGVEKIKTHFFSKYGAVLEIIWKNIAEPGRLQMTIWRMRILCWLDT